MKALLLIALLPLMAACSANGSFPSLAPRSFELPPKSGTSQQPATPVVPVPASNAALLARLASAEARARAGDAEFQTALATARRVVGASSRQRGSESWVAAQMAISRLERTREPVQQALAEIDSEMRLLLTDQNPVDKAALERAMADVGALDRAQLEQVQGLIRAAGR